MTTLLAPEVLHSWHTKAYLTEPSTKESTEESDVSGER